MNLYRLALCLLFVDCAVMSFACSSKNSDEKPKMQHSGRLIGGFSPITKDGMADELFQEALTEVLKRLDEVNKCHSFSLIKVLRAAKQIVAGVKYIMNLDLRPTFLPETDEECNDITRSSVEGKMIAEASIVIKPWMNPKYFITFIPTSDFNKDGVMELTKKTKSWRTMSSEEVKMPVFQKAIQEAVRKLNRDLGECFRLDFIEVLEGKIKFSSNLVYTWDMKVKKVYEYDKSGCLGTCVDDCSGSEIYSAKAVVSPPESGTPQLRDVKFKQRLEKPFVDDLEPGIN